MFLIHQKVLIAFIVFGKQSLEGGVHICNVRKWAWFMSFNERTLQIKKNNHSFYPKTASDGFTLKRK